MGELHQGQPINEHVGGALRLNTDMRYRKIIDGTTAEKVQKAAHKRTKAQQKFSKAQATMRSE